MSIVSRLYKKLVKKYRGIPVMFLIYKPWRKGKNLFVYRLPPFDDDPYITGWCDEIAEHIRSLYQDKLDAIVKGAERDG